MREDEAGKLAAFCEAELDLAHATLSDEYYYQSLPFCVIDAVFSIGVSYTSTRNVVIRFCEHFGLNRISRERMPREAQYAITDLLAAYGEYELDAMTTQIYQNRQRTSSRNGILKAEAVFRFGQVLQQFGVNHLQDVPDVIGDQVFEAKIRQIPGQTSGISLRYFYMLSGSDDYIKPDRMVARFVAAVLEQEVPIADVEAIVIDVYKYLSPKYPALTLRVLDHVIWKYQRGR